MGENQYLDPRCRVTKIYQTEKGTFFSASFIGIRTLGDGEKMEEKDDGVSEYALLVVNQEGEAVFFPFANSNPNEGITNRVVVDGKRGVVYQIMTSNPSFMERVFGGKIPDFSLSSMSVEGEGRMDKKLTPFSADFFEALASLVEDISRNNPTLDPYNLINLVLDYSIPEIATNDPTSTSKGLEKVSFAPPLNSSERAVVFAKLAHMLDSLNQGKTQKIKDLFQKALDTLLGKKPDWERLAEKLEALESPLPEGFPQVYVLKFADETEIMVGVSNFYEGDQSVAFNAPPFVIFPQERLITFGEVTRSDIFNDPEFWNKNNVTLIDNFPFADLVRRNPEFNRELYKRYLRGDMPVDVKCINTISYAYNPATSSIKGGFFYNKYGKGMHFLELGERAFTEDYTHEGKVIENRPLPLFGVKNAPSIIQDVTNQAVDLIKQGYNTAVAGQFNPSVGPAILAHLFGEGKDVSGQSFLDVIVKGLTEKNIQLAKLPTGLTEDLINSGEDPNNLIIVFPSPSQDSQQVSVYLDRKGKESEPLFQVNVPGPIFVTAEEIANFSNDPETPYAVVFTVPTTTEGENISVVVTLTPNNAFMISAEGNKKIAALWTLEAASLVMAMFGGLKAIRNPRETADLIRAVVTRVAQYIMPGG